MGSGVTIAHKEVVGVDLAQSFADGAVIFFGYNFKKILLDGDVLRVFVGKFLQVGYLIKTLEFGVPEAVEFGNIIVKTLLEKFR